MALLLAGGLWLSARPSLVAQPAAPAASVVIVAEQGSVAVEQAALLPAPTAREVPAARADSLPSTAGRPATDSRSARRQPDRPSQPSAGETFSASFSRRTQEIRHCFSEHSKRTASELELSLRFEVARDGRVSSATLQPASIGSTPLGKCLVEVANATRFARQPNPVAFHIPLSVQMDGRRR
jgi:hypothetical protein